MNASRAYWGSVFCAGNGLLVNSGNILSIMVLANGGTLMAGNAKQCIAAPSVTWGQRTDSLISYNASQVWG